MKAGDLVTWTEQWLGTCMSTERADYEIQVGIILWEGKYPKCWHVVWSDEDRVDVHDDYLEVIHASR